MQTQTRSITDSIPVNSFTLQRAVDSFKTSGDRIRLLKTLHDLNVELDVAQAYIGSVSQVRQ